MTAYLLDPSNGTLADFQTISTVPDDFTLADGIGCSQLKISPDGRFLFVITRGHNSIASFKIDPSSGALVATGRVPTEPEAGGGMSKLGRLATYEIDKNSGQLTPLETYDGGNGPMWILMMRLGDC